MTTINESLPPDQRYVFDSAQQPPLIIRELVELWRYRDLLNLLVVNSLKTRYKRSVLGVLWTLLNPLLNTAVLTIAFSQLFRFAIEDYPVYLLAGLVAWGYFSATLNQSLSKVVWGSSLIKRIYLPRVVFVLAVLGNGLVNLVVSLLPLAIVMLIFGVEFSPALLFLPVSVLLLSMFTLGLSLLLSTLAVYFTDVIDLTSVVLSAWFYLTPIIYPREIFPAQFTFLLWLNPMTSLIDLFRAPVFAGTLPDGISIVVASAYSVAFLIIGWVVFAARSDDFAYRL